MSPLPEPELYRNLSREESLLNEGEASPCLSLWRSPQAVVLGKNQNPWKECNLPFLTEKGIALARRISGGGTVYHDPGNVNLCWAMDRKAYQPDAPSDFLIRALSRLGLKAEAGPGGSVWVEGRKVSGSAFAYRRDRVLHHSTLLIQADLPTLRAVLSPPRMQLSTHAVASVPARVGNLLEWIPGGTLEAVVQILWEEARSSGIPASPLQGEGNFERMQSWSWLWGQTPTFRIPGIRVEDKVGTLEIRKGHMVSWESGGKRSLDPPLPLTMEGVQELERAWNLPSKALQTEFECKGWWLPRE